MRLSDKPRVTFKDVLGWLGPDVARSSWRVAGVECFGADEAELLHAASDDARELPGEELLALAKGITQVIEGEFVGAHPGAAEPWVTLRAVDGGLYDVISADHEVLERVRRAWTDVEEIPEGCLG